MSSAQLASHLRTINPRDSRGRSATQIAVITGALISIVLVVIILIGHPTSQSAPPPSWSLAPSGQSVLPGQTGCQNVSGETCFSFVFATQLAGVYLSGLQFEVRGPTISNSPGSSVPMGSQASLNVIASDGSVVGALNWSTSTWISGTNWTIPTSSLVLLVLDTGLQNGQFSGDFFWVHMVSPNYGAVGAEL